MEKYNYSIIIPHKNAPELLFRCVTSIPSREDIQIIVVDDNSDEGIVDWNRFTSDKSKNIELVLTKEGKGAGYARNVGLKHAKGKWILFADCDDYYYNGFLSVLDKYSQGDYEVVYYSYSIKVGDMDNTPKTYNELLSKLNESPNEDVEQLLKYGLRAPWNKIVRKTFIEKYKIHFEESINGNDLFYSYQVGYFSKKIGIELSPLYHYTINPFSLTHKKRSKKDYICILEHAYKSQKFFEFINCTKLQKSPNRVFLSTLQKKGFLTFLQVLKVFFANRKSIVSSKNDFVNYFQSFVF